MNAEKEARTLKIIISHLPYRELSPNSREHWMVKARGVKASREEIGWLAKVEWRHENTPMVKARISYEFYCKNNRKRDVDNLLAMTKPWQDGLIDVDVILKDDSQHLEIGHIKVLPSDIDQTVITIEEIK